jgi:HlyD family secretion protein
MVNMKVGKWLLPLVAISLLIACNRKQKQAEPQIRLLTEAVYASGVLVPENEYKVFSQTDGFIESALVKEGDTVKKGQLLFKLTNENERVQVNAAADALAKTVPVVAPDAPVNKDLESRVASAKIRLQNDELQYNRYKRVYEENAIAASTYEKFKLQFETSQQELNGLQEQLQQQKLSAALQYQQANNLLQIARTSNANGLLKSYADGIVYDLYKQKGDLITPNEPLALIGSGKMIARLLIDEDDLNKIKLRQEVLITLDAFPDKIFHARVEKIYPLLNKQEQSFRVDAFFEEDMPFKLYGLNIEANIVIKERTSVMVIPKTALFGGDSVMVDEAGLLSKVKIHKGAEDKDYVQVLEGLNNESEIITQP